MTELQDLAAAAYVSIESYRRDDAAVRTPVWITADAGKLKRIRNNSKVRLAKCDASGNLEGDWVEAQGRILDSPAALKAQLRRLRAKYGWKYLAYRLISVLRRAESTAIEFTPANSN